MTTKARMRALKRLMQVTPAEEYMFFNYARELASIARYRIQHKLA